VLVRGNPDKSSDGKTIAINNNIQEYLTLALTDGTPITGDYIEKLQSLLSETGCSWWSLPPELQKYIEDQLIPKQDSWTLECYKDKSGIWSFDLPEFLTFKESLCNGTEKDLDYWFEQLTGYQPLTGEMLLLEISKKPLNDYTTTCSWLSEDIFWTESNYYIDDLSGKKLWLCPYLQSLFKEIPSTLWFKITTPEYYQTTQPTGTPKKELDKTFLKNEFYGDYFQDKKEAPKDSIPGVWCYFPLFKTYLKTTKLLSWMKESDLSEIMQLFDLLSDKEKSILLSKWELTYGGNSTGGAK
jgi:hypothetical protein